jgi:hypothetical protein
MLAVEVATYLQWKISSRSTRSMLPIMSGGCTSNILPRVAVVGIGTWLLGVEHHKHDAVRLGIQLGGKHNPAPYCTGAATACTSCTYNALIMD